MLLESDEEEGDSPGRLYIDVTIVVQCTTRPLSAPTRDRLPARTCSEVQHRDTTKLSDCLTTPVDQRHAPSLKIAGAPRSANPDRQRDTVGDRL